MDECENCGYGNGLHQADTEKCPAGGEAPIGKKQEWLDTKYEEKANCCFCGSIKGALIKLHQGWCCTKCFKKTIL